MASKPYDNEAWHGIRPPRREIYVKGLKHSYTLFHLTDLHMGELSRQETKGMTPKRHSYALQRQEFFAKEGFHSAERLDSFMSMAEGLDADLVVMSGDMLDFPSDANVSLLKKAISQCAVPTLYVVGNHDWSFADDYHTRYACALHLPKFESISGQGVDIHWVEYEDLLVVAVNNSCDYVTEEVTQTFLQLCELGKPILLTLHVPLYEESIVTICKERWQGRVLLMGGGGISGDLPATKAFYEAVALNPHTPVVAVLTGHLHFQRYSTLPSGVPQYITDKAYTGGCLVLDLKKSYD